jgi:anti-sigma B factor antagonist
MTVAVTERKGTQVVSLSGEIDLQTSGEVREAVLGCVRGRHPVVVGMAGVRYIDSSGVASLVEGFQLARRQGTPFVLASVSPAAMRVLRLARLDRVFAIADDVDSALDQQA